MKNGLILGNFELSVVIIALNLYKEQKGLAKELYDSVDEITHKINMYKRNCLNKAVKYGKL